MSCWKRNNLFHNQGLWFIPQQTIVSSKHNFNLWRQYRTLQQHREKECNFEEVFFAHPSSKGEREIHFSAAFCHQLSFNRVQKNTLLKVLREEQRIGVVSFLFIFQGCVWTFCSLLRYTIWSPPSISYYNTYIPLLLAKLHGTGVNCSLKFLEDCRLPVFHYTNLSPGVYSLPSFLCCNEA